MDKEEVARPIVDSAVAIHPVHRAQLLTYLKLSGCSIGFLINWKLSRIKDGIQRMIWHE
jgi:GxxExxY protein